MSSVHIRVPREEIEAFCKKWRVREFSLFGSVLRDDFREDSDVDVLVSFEEDPGISLWDMAEMVEELEAMFGRKVDLATKEGLRNPYRRHAILSAREVIYAA
jgi:predicted nucleotidyltransferase